MKYKTVYNGERALIIDRNGKKSVFDGPKRVFLFMEKLEKLQSYVADATQYLIIKYHDGRVIHKKGPIKEWLNRFEHEWIDVKNLYKLNSSEILIVYNRDSETTKVNRRLCKGPCQFMPDANEWTHEFNWHIPDSKSIGHMIKGENKFEILTNKPDFFHYYVNEVRTLDDSLITVKLMIIFELKEIFSMLDKTQDPISDFINAICADVVSFVAKLSFTEFLSNAYKLNDIETYEQLTVRAARTGYNIKSIIYNGYISSNALQAIQDNAIHERAKLRFETELAEQTDRLINLRLKSQNQCLELEAELKKLQVEFEHKKKDAEATFNLNIANKIHEVDLQAKDIERNQSLEVIAKKKEIEEGHWVSLNELGVKIDKYEIEVAKRRNMLDRVYDFVK